MLNFINFLAAGRRGTINVQTDEELHHSLITSRRIGPSLHLAEGPHLKLTVERTSWPRPSDHRIGRHLGGDQEGFIICCCGKQLLQLFMKPLRPPSPQLNGADPPAWTRGSRTGTVPAGGRRIHHSDPPSPQRCSNHQGRSRRQVFEDLEAQRVLLEELEAAEETII